MMVQLKSLRYGASMCALSLKLHRPILLTSPSSFSLHFSSPSFSNTNTCSRPTSEWRGLQAWRTSPVNENRKWGTNGAEGPELASSVVEENYENGGRVSSLAEWGSLVLSTADPARKAWLSHCAYKQWCQQKLPLGIARAPDRPARPDKPMLVSPKEIPLPKNSPMPHNAHILHNLAHIELNAIDLAWDTVVRFSSVSEVLGSQFFSDFAHVADDESRHFGWCFQRLAELGFRYGDMPAHNLLWRECQKTSGSVAARLAVIPMVQEARGLDAGPRLVQKLIGLGDNRTAGIVEHIAEEEVAHVAVGVSWFLSVCKKMGQIPDRTFKELLEEFDVELKGPFNHSARAEAGIPRDWYDTSDSDLLRCGKHTSVTNDNMEMTLQVGSTELPCSKLHDIPTFQEVSKTTNSDLSEVYERLACIIAMERENSEL